MSNDETDSLPRKCMSDSHDRRPGVINVTVILFHDHGSHEKDHKNQNKDTQYSDRCFLPDEKSLSMEGDGTGVLRVRVLDLSNLYKEASASNQNDSDIHKFAEALALRLHEAVGSGKHPVILVGEGFGGHIIKHVLLTLARLASQWVEEDTYSKENLKILLERVQGIFYYDVRIQDSTGGLPEELGFSSRETSASMTRLNVDFKKFRTMRKIKTYALVQEPDLNAGLESVVPFDVDSYKTAPGQTLADRNSASVRVLYSFVKSVLGGQEISGTKTTHRKPSAVATSEAGSRASQGIQC